MEEKNDGSDIPKTEKNKIDLSNIESFFNADTIPKKIPRVIAKTIEVIAKTKVTGNVSDKIEVTGFPLLENDSLR